MTHDKFILREEISNTMHNKTVRNLYLPLCSWKCDVLFLYAVNFVIPICGYHF